MTPKARFNLFVTRTCEKIHTRGKCCFVRLCSQPVTSWQPQSGRTDGRRGGLWVDCLFFAEIEKKGKVFFRLPPYYVLVNCFCHFHKPIRLYDTLLNDFLLFCLCCVERILLSLLLLVNSNFVNKIWLEILGGLFSDNDNDMSYGNGILAFRRPQKNKISGIAINQTPRRKCGFVMFGMEKTFWGFMLLL